MEAIFKGNLRPDQGKASSFHRHLYPVFYCPAFLVTSVTSVTSVTKAYFCNIRNIRNLMLLKSAFCNICNIFRGLMLCSKNMPKARITLHF